jgi:serine/threonine protein kinase
MSSRVNQDTDALANALSQLMWSSRALGVRALSEMRRLFQALHKKGILHRDIKPSNVLVTAEHHLKIGDLGIGKVLKKNMAHTAIGMPAYMAPEGGHLACP